MSDYLNEIEKNETLARKWKTLQDYLKSLGSLAIAFSGGVDSTFLLTAAREALGDNVLAVTAASSSFPERERQEAILFCQELGIRHICIESSELDIPGFRENPPNRCYLCKKAIFTELLLAARENGIEYVAEGSNMDDLGDYRPGLKAIEELEVKSPLRQAELYKSEIRKLSEILGLPTASKPSFACLASRFVYGEEINEKKLAMVGAAEELLLDLGFKQYRVRMHGEMARIEILLEQFPLMMKEENRTRIYDRFKKLGFSYIAMDLAGYRSGSMNEGFADSLKAT